MTQNIIFIYILRKNLKKILKKISLLYDKINVIVHPRNNHTQHHFIFENASFFFFFEILTSKKYMPVGEKRIKGLDIGAVLFRGLLGKTSQKNETEEKLLLLNIFENFTIPTLLFLQKALKLVKRFS